MTVIQNGENSVLLTRPINRCPNKLKPAIVGTSDLVFCPSCKQDIKVEDERIGLCPLCDGKISDLFETELRDVLSRKCNTKIESRIVKIKEVEKAFDFVSNDLCYLGDAKFYKALDVPAAKWSTIAEYVWLLQFTQAKYKFLVFGRDRSVPERWLARHRSLIGDIRFYFYDHKEKEMEEL